METLLPVSAVLLELSRLLGEQLVQIVTLVLIQLMELAAAVCALEELSVERVQEGARRVPQARSAEQALVHVDHVRQESTVPWTWSSALLVTQESLVEKVRFLVLHRAQLERSLEPVLRTARNVWQGRSQPLVRQFAGSVTLENGVTKRVAVADYVVLVNTVLLLLQNAQSVTLRRVRSPVPREKALVGPAFQGKEPMAS